MYLLVAGLCLFGPALSMGSREKEAAEQASCSLYQADGAGGRRGGGVMEGMQERKE